MISRNDQNIFPKKYIIQGNWLKEYQDYSIYLKKIDISKDTIDWRLKHIRGFLYYLQSSNIAINCIKPNNVYSYIASLKNLSARTVEHRGICIRFFLNWLFDTKKISINGNSILPNIKCNKNEKLITYYTVEELKKLLNAININKENGKRDLAIMLLFIRLGMRQRDVQTLKLDSIKWNENKMIILQSKTNYSITYPLIVEIRYALIDYLKNERPISKSPYVFIDNNSQIYSDHFFYNLVNKYFTKAKINIKGKKHGAHSIRHSLAMSLLNHGNSLYEISSILGHKNINDTITYTKVDIKQLKIISLEVPTWKN